MLTERIVAAMSKIKDMGREEMANADALGRSATGRDKNGQYKDILANALVAEQNLETASPTLVDGHDRRFAMPTCYCTIIGGPNGSGKSTIYDRIELPGEFINADNIAKHLEGDSSAAGTAVAGRIAIKLIRQKIRDKESFVFETTLSSAHSLEVMRSAAANGFEVGLIFVVLESPELNIARVANRVSKGGHHIPDDVIRRRYDKAMRSLPAAISIADVAHIFDNSGEEPHHVTGVEGGSLSHLHCDDSNAFQDLLAKSVRGALSVQVAGS
jgi:predicted ABC-type ATPase